MKNEITTYGFTQEQAKLLTEVLWDGYGLHLAETVADVITSDAVICLVNGKNLSKEDKAVLQNYYADASEYDCMQIFWIGERQEPFICFDCLPELVAKMDSIIQLAQKQYEIQSMFCCEYALFPDGFIADSLEQDVLNSLRRKYGENPNPIVLKRIRQEWNALMEIEAVPELAAVYELTLWLKRMGQPYWIGGCAPSGFVPYLLGITRVNPLPSELGGHNLVWQEYASYGREPSYVFHLSSKLEPQITAWLKNHWLKKLKGSQWTAAQPYEDHLIRSNMHFLFDLDSEKSQAAEELPSLCREDIYFYLKKHGFVDKDAFRGMCSVRKGRGFPVITVEMRNAEDNWILEVCENVGWLPSRANLLERMIYKNQHPNKAS